MLNKKNVTINYAGIGVTLTPQGQLDLSNDSLCLDIEVKNRLYDNFLEGEGCFVLRLAFESDKQMFSPMVSFLKEEALEFLKQLCDNSLQSLEVFDEIAPKVLYVEKRLEKLPPFSGAEYMNTNILLRIWLHMFIYLRNELTQQHLSLEEYLQKKHSRYHLVGRVYFNLAEHKKDENRPFAFMATYTNQAGQNTIDVQHKPLSKALHEYASADDKEKILDLLRPIHLAAHECEWLEKMVESGNIYRPIKWHANQAFSFLRDTQKLEAAGIVIRMPSNWRMKRASRAQIKIKIGSDTPAYVGAGALLDFKAELTLDSGETLTKEDIVELLAQTEQLVYLRGKWVEVDHDKLKQTLNQFEKYQKLAEKEGISFKEAMRMLAQVDGVTQDNEREVVWLRSQAGPWLEKTLKNLKSPESLSQIDPEKNLKAKLRPYQKAGVEWLYLLTQLGLGGCLADDMGLGKTMQILSLLLILKGRNSTRPNLLIVPASLIGNWLSESKKFAPSLNVMVVHPSQVSGKELQIITDKDFEQYDLVITSYGYATRLPILVNMQWGLVILDEAQAIKNHNTKQTKLVKSMKAQTKICLTGTPIENKLADLWSLFDFINHGLLGSSKMFSNLIKKIDNSSHPDYSPLRTLTSPYILRRLKTDKSIIKDLPEKTELKTYCSLSKKQVTLYQKLVVDLEESLTSLDGDANGLKRRGVILSSLMRFKQICNHPSQWLTDGKWQEKDSGKFQRLREITETIRDKQEKVLIFTQFSEIIEPLKQFLTKVFGKEGLILHGKIPVAKRKKLVDQFQKDIHIPFFILSLKAGGSGLNLTAASHVIHFDRWWNPAVENQATDRAYRIGQKKNVLIHKFITKGTIEEKIDEMIDSKKQLADEFLTGRSEQKLTELSTNEIISLVSLDIQHYINNEQ